MIIERSIDAVNRRDRAEWLSCYRSDVEWDIVDGNRWSGHGGLAAMWDSMVLSGTATDRSVEQALQPSDRLLAAVVTHDGLADGIVICRLDEQGRIAHGRSYRVGEPEVTPAQNAIRRQVVCWNARDRRAWLDGHSSGAVIDFVAEPADGDQAPDAWWDQHRDDPQTDRMHVLTIVGAGAWAAAHLRLRGEDHQVADAIIECRVDAQGRAERCVVYANRGA